MVHNFLSRWLCFGKAVVNSRLAARKVPLFFEGSGTTSSPETRKNNNNKNNNVTPLAIVYVSALMTLPQVSNCWKNRFGQPEKKKKKKKKNKKKKKKKKKQKTALDFFKPNQKGPPSGSQQKSIPPSLAEASAQRGNCPARQARRPAVRRSRGAGGWSSRLRNASAPP